MVYKWHNLSIDSILFFLLLSKTDLPPVGETIFPLQPNVVLFQLSLMGRTLPTAWLEEPADAESIIEDPMVNIRPASAADHIPGSPGLHWPLKVSRPLPFSSLTSMSVTTLFLVLVLTVVLPVPSPSPTTLWILSPWLLPCNSWLWLSPPFCLRTWFSGSPVEHLPPLGHAVTDQPLFPGPSYLEFWLQPRGFNLEPHSPSPLGTVTARQSLLPLHSTKGSCSELTVQRVSLLGSRPLTLTLLLLLLLSRFSRVRLCATPETAAHQAPPSLGFSRQGHWSGLPFPSPMHESEKSKWSRSVISNPQRPHGLQPTRLLHAWDFPGKSTGVGCHRLLQVVWILCNNKIILIPSSHPLYGGLTGGVRAYFTYTWACIIKYIVVVICIFFNFILFLDFT